MDLAYAWRRVSRKLHDRNERLPQAYPRYRLEDPSGELVDWG